VKLPPDTALADTLRDALREAGVTRPDLFGSEATRKPITWYDLRATGITWRAIRGDNPIAIMRQAGHEDFKTTTRYTREAEAVGASLGEPFSPMPRAMLGAAIDKGGPPKGSGEFRRSVLQRLSQVSEIMVGRQGLEPWTYGLKVRSSTD